MGDEELLQDLRKKLGFRIHELGSELITVETSGLEMFERPNLQVAGIPATLGPVARRLMEQVAAYSVAVKEVGNGQTIAVPWERGHNIVRAVESDSPSDRRRWFRPKHQHSTLRLIPPERECPADTPPLLALATELLEFAHERDRAGEPGVALRAAAFSTTVYPGQPGSAARDPYYNIENHRAYELMYWYTRDRAYLQRALARSIDFQMEILGIPIEDLARLPAPEVMVELIQTVRGLVTGVPDQLHEESEDGEPVSMLSPILLVTDDHQLMRGVCVVPPEYARLYYQGPARTLVEDARTPLLVGEIAHRGQGDPVALALLTWSARTWRESQRDLVPLAGLPCYGPASLFSALLAEVARCGAADCTWDELRAHVGLETDAGLDADATSKLEALARNERAWLEQGVERASRCPPRTG